MSFSSIFFISRGVFYTCMQQISVSRHCCQILRIINAHVYYRTWFTVTTYSIQGLVQGLRLCYASVNRSVVLLWEFVSHFLAVCIFSFLKDSIDFESFVPRATEHPLNGVTIRHSQLALPYTHHIIITDISQNDLIYR